MSPSLIWQVMAFYSPDPDMDQRLRALVADLTRPQSAAASDLSITWLRCRRALPERGGFPGVSELPPAPPRGAHWQAQQPRDPAGLVKLFYLVAVEAWLQRRLIADDPELRRAVEAMVRGSGSEGTSLVVDLLSGTTSGPSLPRRRFVQWSSQRRLVNDWFASLGWPELDGINVCQKPWVDGPYGRERDFHGPSMENGNRLTADATARLLHAVMADAVLSPPACRRMRDLLYRSPDPSVRQIRPVTWGAASPGQALPSACRLWGLSDRTDHGHHEAAYAELEGREPVLLVVFSGGMADSKCSVSAAEIARRLILEN